MPDESNKKIAKIELAVRDKQALYAVYMPFVKNGGLFIPNKNEFELGDRLVLILDLMQGAERLEINGSVIWITPRGAAGKRATGVGIQIDEDDNGLNQKKIETYLAGTQDSDRRTHTM